MLNRRISLVVWGVACNVSPIYVCICNIVSLQGACLILIRGYEYPSDKVLQIFPNLYDRILVKLLVGIMYYHASI